MVNYTVLYSLNSFNTINIDYPIIKTIFMIKFTIIILNLHTHSINNILFKILYSQNLYYLNCI